MACEQAKAIGGLSILILSSWLAINGLSAVSLSYRLDATEQEKGADNVTKMALENLPESTFGKVFGFGPYFVAKGYLDANKE